MAAVGKALVEEGLPPDEEIAERVRRGNNPRNGFMYYYKVDEVYEAAIREPDGLKPSNEPVTV